METWTCPVCGWVLEMEPGKIYDLGAHTHVRGADGAIQPGPVTSIRRP